MLKKNRTSTVISRESSISGIASKVILALDGFACIFFNTEELYPGVKSTPTSES